MKKRIYIAGPMTGQPNLNFEAFEEAERLLESQGWEVISPHRLDIEHGWVTVDRAPDGTILSVEKDVAFDWDDALDADLRLIDTCQAIYLLPGWTGSRGAVKEFKYARANAKSILGRHPERMQAVTFVADPEDQPLIGLCGYAQAGKDSLAGFIGYRRIAFADPLRDLALLSDPFVGQGHLSRLVGEVGWERAKTEVPGVREYLQNLGVGLRKVFGYDTWVRAAFDKYNPAEATVFTDVRFKNEIDAIKTRGGLIVRIDRPGTGPANTHISEQDWTDVHPDYTVNNTGNLEDLALQAEELDKMIKAGYASAWIRNQ